MTANPPKRRRHRTSPRTGRPPQAVPVSVATVHLAAVSRLFNTRVFGPVRPRLIACCLNASSRRTSPEVAGSAISPRQGTTDDDTTQPEVDLALLPAPLLQRLLDAFAVQISDRPRLRQVRITLRVSSVLDPPVHWGGAGLILELPDGWPPLTPEAAYALLRLMSSVAARRTPPTESRSTA